MDDEGDLGDQDVGLDALILAAGYGTRLGALASGRPKGLLRVAGRPVLDHLLDRLRPLLQVRRLVLVTNARFADDFRRWAEHVGGPGASRPELEKRAAVPFPIRVLDDGTRSAAERLGAVGDLAFAIEEAGLEGDLLVAASDNVFDFELHGLVERFTAVPRAAAVLTLVEGDDPTRLRGTAVAESAGDRVVRFVERPDDPPSNLTSPALYVLRGPVAPKVRRYLEDGGDPDGIGHFIEWLIARETVLAWRAPGGRHHIGTPEGLADARRQGP